MKRSVLTGFLVSSLALCLFHNVCYAKTTYYSKVLKSDKNTVSSKNISKHDSNMAKSGVLIGDAYCVQYKLDSAKKQFERALKLDPNNSDAHNGLGMVYYLKTSSSDMAIIKKKDELLTSAIKEFELAIKFKAKNAEAYNNLGRVYQEKGNLDKAQENYKKALEINPKYSDAMCNMGSVDFLRNKIPDAIDKYKKALTLDSKSQKAYVCLAEAYASQSNFSDALTEINTSLSLFSNSAVSQNILGKIYDLQGNKVAAINSYRKAINIKPENIEPYLAIADIYQERGDNDLAISELKNALSINPDYKEGYLKLADMLLIENKPELAIAYYQKVVDDQIFSAYALKGLSRAYFNNAKNISDLAYITTNAEYLDAQNALLKAIDANPKDLQLYLALLRVSKLAESDNASQIYLTQIVKKSDFSPIASVIKGEAYLLCNKYNEADLEFANAVNKATEVQDCLYIGEIFILNRQYDMATNAFYKALNLDAENKKARAGLNIIARNKKIADHHYDLAKAYYKEGQKNLTIQELKKAVNFNPKDKKSYLMMAKTYEKLHDYSNSLTNYQAFLGMSDAKDKNYKKYDRKVNCLSKKVKNQKTKPVQNL